MARVVEVCLARRGPEFKSQYCPPQKTEFTKHKCLQNTEDRLGAYESLTIHRSEGQSGSQDVSQEHRFDFHGRHLLNGQTAHGV
jgi:hypothetical protein